MTLRARLLQEAEDALKSAELVVGTTDAILYEQGSIAYTRKDYPKAIDGYAQARDFSRRTAQAEKRDEDWLITYALACCLCKVGRHQDAVNELALIADKTERIGDWGERERIDPKADARSDPDFDVLKTADSEPAREFRHLVGLGEPPDVRPSS